MNQPISAARPNSAGAAWRRPGLEGGAAAARGGARGPPSGHVAGNRVYKAPRGRPPFHYFSPGLLGSLLVGDTCRPSPLSAPQTPSSSSHGEWGPSGLGKSARPRGLRARELPPAPRASPRTVPDGPSPLRLTWLVAGLEGRVHWADTSSVPKTCPGCRPQWKWKAHLIVVRAFPAGPATV